MALTSSAIVLCFDLALSAASFSFTVSHNYSIVGYAPKDLEFHEKLFNLFENWISNSKSFTRALRRSLLGLISSKTT
ncbi:hypothetical protein ARALYDRAFT_895524 [Arabidopsis lyrata subsp. lyrata]|uniref:Uncharacterized protein n=1 Tax=Arabidopsis lyrata subsp. lyrata TaxID=81972 RepID=D7KTT3_ARALL|nr:hypothetical protein ARALYDRAFT_895524 [Arabidopsis lyrata subsp. lyrata]